MVGCSLIETIPKTMYLMKSLPEKIIWVCGMEHLFIQKYGGNLIDEVY